jgi:hypothetical protein
MKPQLSIKRVLSHTLVGGINKTFPVKTGNCFSVEASDGKKYDIVNFYYENYQEVNRLGLKNQIKIRSLSERAAIILDERIPDRWYNNYYCEVCCPESLLPHPQRMRHQRQEARGERVVGKGFIKIDLTKAIRTLPKEKKEPTGPRKLAAGWKVKKAKDIKVYKTYWDADALKDIKRAIKKEMADARRKKN